MVYGCSFRPVLSLKALFCVNFSLCICVTELVEAQAVLAYSSTERMSCCYVIESVNSVPGTALRALSQLLHLLVMSLMLLAKVRDVLYVTPRILVMGACEIGVLFSVIRGL